MIKHEDGSVTVTWDEYLEMFIKPGIPHIWDNTSITYPIKLNENNKGYEAYIEFYGFHGNHNGEHSEYWDSHAINSKTTRHILDWIEVNSEVICKCIVCERLNNL